MAINILLSFAFHISTDLAAVRRNLRCGRVMVDSGAFTAYTSGHPVTVADYARFLEQWRGCWDHAITLDVVGDPAATRANTRALHRRGLPVMPVFTLGGTLADFDAMVRDAGYVAIGGLVRLPQSARRARIGMLQRRAVDLGGGVHALGAGNMAILRKEIPYSSDASTATIGFKFGKLVYFDGRELTQTQVADTVRLRRDQLHIRAHGIELADLVRVRRMPGQDAGRALLVRAMGLAYAVADEVLKTTCSAPVPRLVTDQCGPHLYNSLPRGLDVLPTSELDALLHDPTAPKPNVWSRYGSRHRCRTKEVSP